MAISNGKRKKERRNGPLQAKLTYTILCCYNVAPAHYCYMKLVGSNIRFGFCWSGFMLQPQMVKSVLNKLFSQCSLFAIASAMSKGCEHFILLHIGTHFVHDRFKFQSFRTIVDVSLLNEQILNGLM